MNQGLNLNAMMGNLQRSMGNAVGAMKQMGQMATQIEQIQKIVQLIQGGGNPMELISSFAQKNPQAKEMMQNLSGKNESELKAYAENMAKSYGTTLEDVVKGLGINR